MAVERDEATEQAKRERERARPQHSSLQQGRRERERGGRRPGAWRERVELGEN
jgi:hypothetical protein